MESFRDKTQLLTKSANDIKLLIREGYDISVAQHVVWKEFVGGVNSEILYRRSIDGGTVFDPTLTNISNNPSASIAPAIAVS